MWITGFQKKPSILCTAIILIFMMRVPRLPGLTQKWLQESPGISQLAIELAGPDDSKRITCERDPESCDVGVFLFFVCEINSDSLPSYSCTWEK